jgi:hypothetical protein
MSIRFGGQDRAINGLSSTMSFREPEQSWTDGPIAVSWDQAVGRLGSTGTIEDGGENGKDYPGSAVQQGEG